MIETQDKLNWLAFRYVANELDAIEMNEFESLLMTNQAAREAVASAVAETTRIRRALADVVVTNAAAQRSNWNRQTTRAAIVAVGSCLVLILAICLVRSSLPITGGIAHQAIESELSGSRAQLAYAWAEARNGLTDLQPATNPALTDSLDAVVIAAIDSEPEQSLVAPSWMVAALAKMDSRIDVELQIQE